MKSLTQIGITLSLGILFLISCAKESPNPGPYDEPNKAVYQIMKMYYLWSDQLPSINPLNYSKPQDVLEVLRNPLDRWSNLMSKSDYENYFIAGDYIGHGVSFTGDANGNLVVAFVFNDSPLKAEGVERGWKVKSVNGAAITSDTDFSTLFGESLAGVQNTIVFEDLDGQEHSITTQKKVINMNTVLAKNIVDLGSEKVGYLAFESFIQPSIIELDTTFHYFNENGINDLVVDLRYNGGGDLSISNHLAALITSSTNGGKIYCKLQHNTKMTYMDTIFTIPTGIASPNLNRVFFIASRGTASASEALINGLKPWMDVEVVGDSTYGKPAGMYVFDFDPYDYIFMPVCFKLSNANDYGDYFSGLPANAYVADDLNHQLGSPDEGCLKAILQYISNGSYPVTKGGFEKPIHFNFGNKPGLLRENPIF